jgi:hypothetical protein
MFYHWRNRERFDLESSFAIDQIERDKHLYFKKFKDIAAHANLEWEHINLFFYRETIQEQFVQRIYPRSRLTDFAQKQL